MLAEKTGLVFDMWEVKNAADWLLHKLSNDTEDNLVKISAVLWGVWFARNNQVFEGKKMKSNFIISWSMKQITEWRMANKKTNQHTTGLGASV